MNTSVTTFTGRSYHRLSIILLLFLATACMLRAQDLFTVGNPFVKATVTSSNDATAGGGRFVIDAGPYFGGYRFLYYITSNVVFRVSTGGQNYYYTNAKEQFGGQPTIDGTTPIAYRPFDSIYHSDDTIAVTWKGLAAGYGVTMRLIAEKTRPIFDRGSDVLIEFSYSRADSSTTATLGIFMMLDVYNGEASGAGGGGDKSSVLTSMGYFPTDRPGKLFKGSPDSIPQFYHVGNFLYTLPLNTVLSIHRLKGVSHGGAQLTTPELLAVGNWKTLRNIGWDVTGVDMGGRNVEDAATAVRWSGLGTKGTVRTAFGADDSEGNNLFHCRDSSLFVDIKTERVIAKAKGDSLYRPGSFDATMWVTNTASTQQTSTVVLAEPVGSPIASGRFLLDASTPAAQTVTLAARETKMLRWRLKLAPGMNDTLIDVPLDFRYQVAGGAQARTFRLPCTPVVTIQDESKRHPVSDDLLQPNVEVVESNEESGIFVRRVLDRHAIFFFDTGIDTVIISENDNGNAQVTVEAPTFGRCDTRSDVIVRIVTVDTLRPIRVGITARDCAGNEFRTILQRDAHPFTIDTMPPRIVRLDSTGSAWAIVARDRHQGYIYDTGIDSIVIDLAVNFTVERGSYKRCDTSAAPSMTLRVADPSRDGVAVFSTFDCRGNMRRDTVIYRGTSGVPGDVESRRGPAIVEVAPQPLTGAARSFKLTALGLGRGPLHGELIASDGRVAARFELEGGEGDRVEREVRLARDLVAGVYIVRLRGAGGSATAKVVVVE